MADGKLHGEANFEWRGADVSRLENLSDIVFALVITLAAAQSVPTSFDELTGLWREAISLAACFATLVTIWRTHHVFFRRYDLQDGTTLTLNSVLLLLILVYIYPLKFMTDFIVDYFTGVYPGDAVVEVLTISQVSWLYVIYGCFFAGVYGVFALLYRHALTRADDIGLSKRERAYTQFEIEFGIGVVGLTGLIIALAFILPDTISPFMGTLFGFMGTIAWVCGKRAEARATA